MKNLHTYPSSVLSYNWERTFQKIHWMCHCYYCSVISPFRSSSLAKTILIPAHSSLPFSRKNFARVRFVLTFAIAFTWSRHRSYREKWRTPCFALTAFSHCPVSGTTASFATHTQTHFCYSFRKMKAHSSYVFSPRKY